MALKSARRGRQSMRSETPIGPVSPTTYIYERYCTLSKIAIANYNFSKELYSSMEYSVHFSIDLCLMLSIEYYL